MKLTKIMTGALAALAACTLALGSCYSHDDDNVMSTIPDNTMWVAKVNADRILSNAGITMDGTRYKLSETLEDLSRNLSGREQEVLDQILSLMPAVDTENIYLYMTAGKEVIATCLMEHRSQLMKALTERFGEPESEGDFKIYEINGDVLVIRGNQMWAGDKASYIIDAVRSASEKGSLADAPGYSRYFGADKAVTVINDYRMLAGILGKNGIPINTDEMPDKMAWYIDLQNESMILGGGGFSNDGTEKPITDTKINRIEKSGLVYVPDNAIATIAMGSFKEGLMSEILDEAGIYDTTVKEILEGINGTVTVSAVAPADVNDLFRVPAWNLTLSIGMEADAARRTMTAVEQLIHPQEADGMKILDFGSPYMIGGGKIYYRYFEDGYLAAGTMPVSNDNNCQLVKDMPGQLAALHAYEGKDGNIARAFDMPWGINLYTREAGNGGEVVLTLEGSDRPFIDAILTLATDSNWQRNAMKRLGMMEMF